MTITFGSSNISSLTAQRSLGDATSKVADAFKQLSSGLRINNASDDAAGLAIATALDSHNKVFTQAIRNVNDGISYAQVAESALDTLGNILQRQLELAEESGNGTFSTPQRQALQTEADALSKEYNRIVSTTTFNNANIFTTNAAGTLQLQVGFGATNQEKVALDQDLGRTINSGVFSPTASGGGFYSSQAAAADFNGDGILDIVSYGNNSIYLFTGRGDGTFNTTYVGDTGNPNSFGIATGDVDGDGDTDFVIGTWQNSHAYVFTNNGHGTLTESSSIALDNGSRRIQLADLNGDGISDLVTQDFNAGNLDVLLGTSSGQFSAPISYATNYVFNAAVGDVTGDGKLDIVTADFELLAGNGDGTFSNKGTKSTGGGFEAITIGDVNRDGIGDVVLNESGVLKAYFSLGGGAFAAPVTIGSSDAPGIALADVDGDGFLDILTHGSSAQYAHNNGDGTFGALQTIGTGLGGGNSDIIAADFNNDGALDVLLTSGGATSQLRLGVKTQTTTTQFLNLSSTTSSRSSLDYLTQQYQRVTSQKGKIGAFQSRISYTLQNLQSSEQNGEEALSRIRDADIAQQSAILIRQRILQQAATAVLAQANQQPELALKLLS